MNLDLRDLMSTRADSVDPPVFDPLAIAADGERLVRRRRRFVATGAALALAVTLGTSAVVLDHGEDRAVPAGQVEWTPGSRPLTWGEGQTIHLGDREVDTGLDFLSLDVTDDGAAFTTLDGGIWFTDGSTIEQVGATIGGRPHAQGIGWGASGRPPDWVVNDQAGSLLAWQEYPTGPAGSPELVVFDSAQGTVVGRATMEVGQRERTVVAAVTDRQVFVSIDFGATLLRYDVDSDALDDVRPAVLEEARRGVGRTLVVGLSAPQEGRLIPDDDMSGQIPVKNSRLDLLFDVRTGARLDLQVSRDLELIPGFLEVYFVQWLDDDRFTVVTTLGGGDLLVCRISAGRCEVTIDSESWRFLGSPGMHAPLLPGHGGLGAELALGVAMKAAID